MTADRLREEVSIELELIETLLSELASLLEDVARRKPTLREKTAASAFLAQFYGGVENILKRISKFHSVSLPSGGTWHLDLFERFCAPPHHLLPELFDKRLETDLSAFRQFRHVAYHSYGLQIEWVRMKEGIEKVESVYSRFKTKLTDYLDSL